jgi:hypothetical protein
MAQVGGRSQAEERLCEAAAILMISRRRKALYGGLFRKLNYCPYPASSLSAPRFGGSGPCIVKVEQQFSFAFLGKWIYF